MLPANVISNQIAYQRGINLLSASDECLLEVYILTLQTILDTILQVDLQSLPAKSLTELKEGLRETIQFFFEIRSRDLGSRFPMRDIIATISEAYTALLNAASILERGRKTRTYYKEIQNCRDRIFDTIELLRAS